MKTGEDALKTQTQNYLLSFNQDQLANLCAVKDNLIRQQKNYIDMLEKQIETISAEIAKLSGKSSFKGHGR